MKKDLKGKVGTSVARNISKREGWEKDSEGSAPESSRMHGRTLIHQHSRQSDAGITLSDFEKNSGHDPRKRAGSPTVGSGKRFGK